MIQEINLNDYQVLVFARMRSLLKASGFPGTDVRIVKRHDGCKKILVYCPRKLCRHTLDYKRLEDAYEKEVKVANLAEKLARMVTRRFNRRLEAMAVADRLFADGE